MAAFRAVSALGIKVSLVPGDTGTLTVEIVNMRTWPVEVQILVFTEDADLSDRLTTVDVRFTFPGAQFA